MMTPSSLGQCWANLPSAIGDNGKRCLSRVDPRDPVGLCQPCKRRLRDESQVSVPNRTPRMDRPSTIQGRQWAQEAGLM